MDDSNITPIAAPATYEITEWQLTAIITLIQAATERGILQPAELVTVGTLYTDLIEQYEAANPTKE